MSGNCFVREEATADTISNVASFCSQCYNSIVENEIIFYDMKNYRYLCSTCQSELVENLDINCEPIDTDSTSLFN